MSNPDRKFSQVAGQVTVPVVNAAAEGDRVKVSFRDRTQIKGYGYASHVDGVLSADGRFVRVEFRPESNAVDVQAFSHVLIPVDSGMTLSVYR